MLSNGRVTRAARRSGRFACVLFVGAALLLCGFVAGPRAHAADGSDLTRIDRELRGLAKKVRPSVVSVRIVATGSEVDPEDAESGTAAAVPTRRVVYRASGLVASSKGDIITIVDGALNESDVDPSETLTIEVEFEDGTITPATVRGNDPETGIALLETTEPPRRPRAVRFSRVRPTVGATVVSVGVQSFALGIIADPARGISLGGTSFPRGIVTTIDAQPGDVGGMLANPEGEVVGILAYSLLDGGGTGRVDAETSETVAEVRPEDTAAGRTGRAGSEGLGITKVTQPRDGGPLGRSVAIPADLLLHIVTQLREEGVVTRGALGASFKLHDPGCESTHIGQGVLVCALVPGGAAESAGLQVGDVIQQIDGKRVRRSSDLLWFRERVEYGEIGRRLSLRVARRIGNRVVSKDLRVAIGARSSDIPEEDATETPPPALDPAPAESPTPTGE